MKFKFFVRSSSGKENLQELIDTISQFPPIVHLNGFTKINRKLLTTVSEISEICAIGLGEDD